MRSLLGFNGTGLEREFQLTPRGELADPHMANMALSRSKMSRWTPFDLLDL